MKAYAIPVAWSDARRGFWTRRKRSTAGLFVVLTMLAGVAVAFKLFEDDVPNNVVRDSTTFDYQVFKRDPEVGDVNFVQTGPTVAIFQPTQQFPGDTKTVEVRIDNINAQPVDASFAVHIDGISVLDQNNLTPANPAAARRFINSFHLAIDKEKVLRLQGEDVANEDDHGLLTGGLNADPDNNLRPDPISYANACDLPIYAITRTNACKLGTVRGSGTEDILGGGLDARYYLFKLSEDDDGDQTEFIGWTLTFNIIFSARVPAEPEPPGPLPVDER